MRPNPEDWRGLLRDGSWVRVAEEIEVLCHRIRPDDVVLVSTGQLNRAMAPGFIVHVLTGHEEEYRRYLPTSVPVGEGRLPVHVVGFLQSSEERPRGWLRVLRWLGHCGGMY
jgi:hypothetical protein